VITRFEPWMALTFSEGSIGGDIERVDLRGLEAFYGKRQETSASAAPKKESLVPQKRSSAQIRQRSTPNACANASRKSSILATALGVDSTKLLQCSNSGSLSGQ